MSNLADLLFRTVDGVFAVDAKQQIIFWNPGCAQLFGRSAETALGRPCSEVVRGKDSADQPLCGGDCGVAELTNGGLGPTDFSMRVRDNNDELLELSVNIVLVPSRRKDMWACVHLLHRGEAVDTFDMLEGYGVEKSKAVRHTSGARSRKEADLQCSLTAREYEILRLLAEGMHVSAMAQLLNISPVTIRNHIQHIEGKLGVHSQVEAVAYAYRHKLVS